MSGAEETVVPLLVDLVAELQRALCDAKKLLASQKKGGQSREEMAPMLQKLLRKASAVQVGLGEVPSKEKERKKKGGKRARHDEESGSDEAGESGDDEYNEENEPAAAKKRAASNEEVEENDDEDEDENDNNDNDEEEEREVAASRSGKLFDGCPAVRQGGPEGELLFFVASGPRQDKLLLCQSSSSAAPVPVARRLLRLAPLSSLSPPLRDWFLARLLADTLRRLAANAPALLADRGAFMLLARARLQRQPDSLAALIEEFSVRGEQAASASPQLCAANNTALMLAATLHAQMLARPSQGWYRRFQLRLQEMCRRCRLRQATLVRYHPAGALMLRSRALACMLPSFVAANKSAFLLLLQMPHAVQALDQAADRLLAQANHPDVHPHNDDLNSEEMRLFNF